MNCVDYLDWSVIQRKANLRPSEVEEAKSLLRKFPLMIPMSRLRGLEDITEVYDLEELYDNDRVGRYIVGEYLCNHPSVEETFRGKYKYYSAEVYPPSTYNDNKWEIIFEVDDSEEPLTLEMSDQLKSALEAKLGSDFVVYVEPQE